MIKRCINYILVLMVFLSCFSFKAWAQNTQVIAKLDQNNIRIGDQIKLHLSVEQPLKEQIIFPKLADTLTGKILVVDSSKMDTIPDQKDRSRVTVTKSVTITCFDAGSYTIPSFIFASKTAELKSNELSLTVTAVKVDTTKAMFDIKQPLAVSYSWIDWIKDNWPLILFSLLGILLIAGLIYYFKKRPKKDVVKVVAKPALPAHILALNKLKELRDKKMWQREEMIKLYYSELSDIIREYLEKRYQVKTQEKTTDEIFAGIKYLDIAQENKNMLHQLLIIADLVKFAKEKPLSAESERNMDNAIDFVLKTQQVERSQNIEGGNSGEHH